MKSGVSTGLKIPRGVLHSKHHYVPTPTQNPHISAIVGSSLSGWLFCHCVCVCGGGGECLALKNYTKNSSYFFSFSRPLTQNVGSSGVCWELVSFLDGCGEERHSLLKVIDKLWDWWIHQKGSLDWLWWDQVRQRPGEGEFSQCLEYSLVAQKGIQLQPSMVLEKLSVSVQHLYIVQNQIKLVCLITCTHLIICTLFNAIFLFHCASYSQIFVNIDLPVYIVNNPPCAESLIVVEPLDIIYRGKSSACDKWHSVPNFVVVPWIHVYCILLFYTFISLDNMSIFFLWNIHHHFK